MVNGNGRAQIWGQNILAVQARIDSILLPSGQPSYVDGGVVGLEIDIGVGWDASPHPFQYSAGFSKVGLQIYANGGSKHISAGAAIWTPDTANNGSDYFYEGIAISHCVNNGLHFYRQPNPRQMQRRPSQMLRSSTRALRRPWSRSAARMAQSSTCR